MKLENMMAAIREIYSLNVELIRNILRRRDFPSPRKVNYSNIYAELHKRCSPTFVLSTGRCGTKLLTVMMEKDPHITVKHTPNPELIYYSRYAYEHQDDAETLQRIVDAARLDILQRAYIGNKHYIETNNRITFFAPALSVLYPRSRFIHVVRHPGDFVRSGIRRKWYKGISTHDIGRIVPMDEEIPWNKMSDIERSSWLWNETNLFIENAKSELKGTGRYLTIRAEDMFKKPEVIKQIYRHIGAKPPADEAIRSVISSPVNSQSGKDFPRYEEWSKSQKDELEHWATLTSKYKYEL